MGGYALRVWPTGRIKFQNLKWIPQLGFMMAISLRQHSVAVLVIGWTILSIALSGSAFAQFKPGIDLMREKPKDPATEAYKKAVDNEYKSKLKTIPDQPQKKKDPWGSIRNSSPSQK